MCCVVLAVSLAGGFGAKAGDLAVQDARVGLHDDLTRFVLEFNAFARPDLFTLSDDYRLVIDLPEVDWDVKTGAVLRGKGLVARVRYARNRPGQSRVVLDLTGPAAIASKQILPPDDKGKGYRLVIDLERTSPGDFMRTAGWPARHLLANNGALGAAPEPVSAEPPAAAAPRTLKKRVIVLDPGHGGKDPGAVGVTGIYEKDVVLDMSKELKKLLEATGRYTVHLTRDDDSFIKLPDRVAFARDKQADLFISVHADSNPVASARGSSVYTLSETASDKAAARLARKENAINGLESEQVSNDVLKILVELAQRDTMNNSVRFAQTLLPTLESHEIRLLRNTHRFGPFWVLTAADVPSVLLEMGFMSNRDDELLLQSKEWRAQLGGGLMAAIDTYFGHDEIARIAGEAITAMAGRRGQTAEN